MLLFCAILRINEGRNYDEKAEGIAFIGGSSESDYGNGWKNVRRYGVAENLFLSKAEEETTQEELILSSRSNGWRWN